MRECGECTKCCEWLIGEAYGWDFGGENKACRFMDCNGCKVHRFRPNLCINYFCAWTQELLPEEMRPDRCGILASVENKEDTQYLKLVGELNSDTELFFKEWSKKMNTPVIFNNRKL